MNEAPPSDAQVDVADHPMAARWLKETALNDPEGYLRLVRPNTRRLTVLYGAPTWKSDGKAGWDVAWTRLEEGLSWVILTGSGGTVFRLRVPSDGNDHLTDPRVGIGITRFLQSLLDRVSRDSP